MEIDAASIYTGRILRQDSPFNDILAYGTRFVFRKGENLYMDDKLDNVFFYIDKGCVTLYHDLPNGKCINIIKLFSGNTFATSISVVSDFTNFRTYNVHFTFDEETVAWSFPSKFLTDSDKIVQYPNVIAYVLKQQCIKTLIMHNNFTMRNEDSAEKMVCNFILNMSKDNDKSSEIVNPNISQTTLAASLGIHRTTLNRALHRLREKKVIGAFSAAKIEIIDMDKLLLIALS
ncbi:MAG: Crp/Fnr family transcriptional regulator [Mailhella sp.]|nr:Crp/Fnr family transcriptional regulator [Mailhella sp.]